MRTKKPLLTLIAALAACSLFAAAAEATPVSMPLVTYASPTGTGISSICASSDPCNIYDAVNGVANGGEVVLAPGDYDLSAGTLNISRGQTVHGTADAAATRLTAPTYAVVAVTGSTLTHVRLSETTVGGWALQVNSGEIHNVVASSQYGIGCRVVGTVTITDTMCVGRSTSGSGLSIYGSPSVVTLRNVTAVLGDGSSGMFLGVGFECSGATGSTNTVDAVNVIAHAYNGTADLFAANCDINFSHSNYSTVQSSASTIISSSHQTAPPAFVNPAGGDFHQSAGSPTLDAGAADALNGATDIDGENRTMGSAIDIGADEFTVAPPTPPAPVPPAEDPPAADRTAPDTTITSGPAGRTKKHSANFVFASSESNSTFMCQLDNEPYAVCAANFSVMKLKPGKHKLRVYATDAAGNADQVPAFHTWRVLSG